jgi:hypothetical protein
MSSREMTLMREASLSLMAIGGRRDFPQLAVDPETHPVV